MIGIESATAMEEAMAMMCVLRVGNARFGIEANRICEVLGEMASKSVPLAPKYIDGVVPYRGEVLTAVSLRMLLGLEESKGASCVLVLNDDDAEERFGLVVDAVEGLITTPRDALEPNPSSLDAQSMFLFDGLYRTHSALIVHLNTQQLRPSRIAQAGLFDQTGNERSGWIQ
jgi:purine-binding chemotaxis protein CheW